MADRALQHRRVHNLLLIRKLLSLRDNISPFTLVLDTIEQTANSLLKLYLKNAVVSKNSIIFVSFEKNILPPDVQDYANAVFIRARRKDPLAVQAEILEAASKKAKDHPSKRILVVFDNLWWLSAPEFTEKFPAISSFLTPISSASPLASILGVYHTDVPDLSAVPTSSSNPPSYTPYTPSPLDLLQYFATTILTLHSLPQDLARKRARERSAPEPQFGLAEEKDGIIFGLDPPASTLQPTSRHGPELEQIDLTPGDYVVEMQQRRKSGRELHDTFVFPTLFTPNPSKNTVVSAESVMSKIILLDDHPLYAPPSAAPPGDAGDESDLTFDLNLTDQQRRDREAVVLPYYDAQRRDADAKSSGVDGTGAGEGGRIIYEMGVEDDFDEEEDEI